MSTTATYAVTMADLKGETAHGSLWSNYGGPVHLTGRFNPLDSSLSNPSSVPSLSARPRSSQPAMDHPPFHYGRYSQDDTDTYEKHPQPSLSAHSSFPNLKRPYSQTDQPSYSDVVQDLRDDGSKLSVNHDHKLLSFKRVQDKHTIVDQHGRMQQLELSAQLHGMFFLSEMPSGSSEAGLQPELTCYRRNLFQVSGSLITPRGPLSVINESGETTPVTSTEVTISAIESVDGNAVRLIVIPWKTPPPNSPEISQTPDQEPPSLPLIPFQDDGSESDGEYAVYPIGWRRLQFRMYAFLFPSSTSPSCDFRSMLISNLDAARPPTMEEGKSCSNTLSYTSRLSVHWATATKLFLPKPQHRPSSFGDVVQETSRLARRFRCLAPVPALEVKHWSKQV
jgi:hypothetical protein